MRQMMYIKTVFNVFFMNRFSMAKRFSLTWGRALALLVLIWLVPLAFFCNLLLSGDETRVAGISAGILLTQDWLVPYLNGKPFLEYPPLYYWWVGLFLKIFGVCEWAASLASTVAAAGSVGLVWKIVRRTGGSDMLAAAAGMMLMSSAQFLDDSHMVRADILLTFFVALAFYGFCILVRCGGTSRKWDDFRGWLLLALGVGGGVMTKGLVGFVLPASCMGMYLLCNDLWARRFRIRPWLLTGAAFLAGMIPVLLWGWALYQRPGGPEMVHTVAIVNNLGRFTGSQGDHVAPFYEYWLGLPALFQPYLVLVFAGLWVLGRKVRREQDRKALLFVLYLLMPFLILNIASAKRVVYLLPLAPAAALVAAEGGAWLLERLAVLREWIRMVPPFLLSGLPRWSGKVIAVFVQVYDRAARTSLRTWFCFFAGVGIVVVAALISVSYIRQEKDTVRGLWQCAAKIAARENRAIVLIQPPERASGAAVFFLGRVVEDRREMTLAGKPELWILRRRWPDKYRKNDRHRMFRMPEDYDKLQKLISRQ